MIFVEFCLRTESSSFHFHGLSAVFESFSLQSWDIFQDFVSSFWVLSAHLIIWLTSLRCLVFNTNWAKPPFWFELLLSVFLTSVLVLISFNVFFFCGESSSATHFSGYSFGGGSFTKGLENYFFYSIHFESNDACKITPYWNIFQLLFWWLISQFSFSLKVWSSKVRCSMKSLNCGKVCVESFQAHTGRKIIFLIANMDHPLSIYHFGPGDICLHFYKILVCMILEKNHFAFIKATSCQKIRKIRNNFYMSSKTAISILFFAIT